MFSSYFLDIILFAFLTGYYCLKTLKFSIPTFFEVEQMQKKRTKSLSKHRKKVEHIFQWKFESNK